jgi:hypothetical protein
MINAYPLTWPEGWKRTTVNLRTRAHFNKKERQYSSPIAGVQQHSWMRSRDLTVSDGIARVLEELERMGVDRQDVIISTNVRTRLDGLPRSGQSEPEDPGAAVYWKIGKEPMRSMAIDRYDRVADNLAALGATLEAMRAIERHGGAEILNRAFLGFRGFAGESFAIMAPPALDSKKMRRSPWMQSSRGSARWPTSTIPIKAAIQTNGKTFALRVKMRSGTSRSLHDRYTENPPIRRAKHAGGEVSARGADRARPGRF